MSDLELFLHSETPEVPALVKAGLAHVQIETIHPFLDGNGRLGRLLITLFLCERGVLRDPLLFLSLYFKVNRAAYYDKLQAVREEGDWEGWLEFFLTGVLETATQAAETARRILALFEADRRAIENLGRPASSAFRVHQLLQTKPLITIPMGADALGLSRPTITSSLAHLEAAGIVRETTGRQRGRAFVYDRYLRFLTRERSRFRERHHERSQTQLDCITRRGAHRLHRRMTVVSSWGCLGLEGERRQNRLITGHEVSPPRPAARHGHHDFYASLRLPKRRGFAGRSPTETLPSHGQWPW